MSRRTWLHLGTTGCALVVAAMIASALTIIDKEHFGWMVGPRFLMGIATAVIIGGLLLFIAALNLPERKTWRGIVLIVWALVALTSPALGYLFLLPWAVLVLMLPLVIVSLVALYRA